jgi:hypothetical protein
VLRNGEADADAHLHGQHVRSALGLRDGLGRVRALSDRAAAERDLVSGLPRVAEHHGWDRWPHGGANNGDLRASQSPDRPDRNNNPCGVEPSTAHACHRL